jgi:thymidylate synthase (FAD)
MADQQQLARVTVPELDRILGHRWPVLDDGFIRVIDYMGSDESIVQAARVSYGTGTKAIHEDVGLVRYLMRHQHTTPFEMCEIKLHVRVPMDTWRQWIRHRTANVNEYSTRYSVAIDATSSTAANGWRQQSLRGKQGSEGFLSEEMGRQLTRREAELHFYTREVYEERLAMGVAREQARKDLPLSTYTESYWKIDLHNLLHFLRLRMDDHAQQEIRAYALVIGDEIVRRWCPVTWQAFRDYQLNSLSLSGLEVAVVRSLVSGEREVALRVATKYGWLQMRDGKLRSNRERIEAESKLKALGLNPPWQETS